MTMRIYFIVFDEWDKVEEVEFVWEIKKFYLLREEKLSPIFLVGSGSNRHQW